MQANESKIESQNVVRVMFESSMSKFYDIRSSASNILLCNLGKSYLPKTIIKNISTQVSDKLKKYFFRSDRTEFKEDN